MVSPKRPIRFELFVSYAHRDNREEHEGKIDALVRRIRKSFEEIVGRDDLSVFYDTSEIRSMDDWRERIFTGLVQSRMMVAILSPNYFASRFCRREWAEYVASELEHALPGEGIAPIYVISHPDFDAASDGGTQVDRWFRDLERRQQVRWVEWWPWGQRALELSGVDDEIARLIENIRTRVEWYDLRDGAPRNTALRLPSPHFKGRREELRQLREQLVPGSIGAAVAIHGVRGVGKTQLAFPYAWGFGAKYPGGRFLIPAAGLGSDADSAILGLRRAVVDLAPCIGVDVESIKSTIDLELAFNRVVTEFQSRQSALFIVDNVDTPVVLTPQVLETALPFGDHIHVIATTWLGETQQTRLQWLPIDSLHPEDAEALLDGLYPIPSNEAEQQAAREIVIRLGGHPFALEVLGVYLRERNDPDSPPAFRQSLTYSAVRDWLAEEGLAIIDHDLSPELQGDLAGHSLKLLAHLFQPTLDRLSKSAIERRALEYAALLPPDCVPLPWLHELLSRDFPNATPDPRTGDPVAKALGRLHALRLLTVDSEQLSASTARTHRVLAQIVRERMEHSSFIQLGRAINIFVSRRVFQLAEGQPLADAAELNALTAFTLELSEDWGGAMLAPSLALVLRRWGRNDQALLVSRKGVSTWRIAQAETHDCAIPLVESLVGLGDLEFITGQYNLATKAYAEGLQVMAPEGNRVGQFPMHAYCTALCHARLADQWLRVGEDEDAERREQHILFHTDQADQFCKKVLPLAEALDQPEMEVESHRLRACDLQASLLAGKAEWLGEKGKWEEVADCCYLAFKKLLEPLPSLRQGNPAGGMIAGLSLLLIRGLRAEPKVAEDVATVSGFMLAFAKQERRTVGDAPGHLKADICATRLGSLLDMSAGKLDRAQAHEQEIQHLLILLGEAAGDDVVTDLKSRLGY